MNHFPLAICNVPVFADCAHTPDGRGGFFKPMSTNTEKWAMQKLRDYSADDFIEQERLAPLLAAYDSGNRAQWINEVRNLGDLYRAADIFIDRLCEMAERGEL